MSVQKVIASLLNSTQETTFALANLNFDFSLFTIEAPPEFKPLGDELTAVRRKAAEQGTPHITARKLGALFQQVLPPTPNLIRAYGRRVSEIASSPTVNPKGSKAHGIFADQVGVDGTTIWAAATSGPQSIAVHLLACMLARLWSATEAISIWVELVEERKRELERSDPSEPSHYSSVATSQITVSREQLAEWDASARAWLRAADEVMKLKQTQLMLILSGTNVPVNNHRNMYQSVLQAWNSAMIATDKLVQGIPQSIQDGAVLLGISSWHLFPDMIVLGKESKQIVQGDAIIAPGGLLTIGLQMESQEYDNGVYWSLPLAYLHYYGGPVLSTQSITMQGNRISVQQLLQVAIGCLLKGWQLEMIEAAQILTQLSEYLSSVKIQDPYGRAVVHWLNLLATAVEPALGTNDLEQRSCHQLIRLGQRRCGNFLFKETDKIPPLFGISDLGKLIPLLDGENLKIDILRSVARRIADSDNRRFVIRYSVHWGDTNEYEYATALPVPRSSCKRKSSEMSSNAVGHTRWVVTFQRHGKGYQYNGSRLSDIQMLGEDAFSAEGEQIRNRIMETDLPPSCFLWEKIPEIFSKPTVPISFDAYLNLDHCEEGSPLIQDESFGRENVKFTFVAGDLQIAALFVADDDGAKYEPKVKDMSGFVLKAVKSQALNKSRFISHLNNFFMDESCSSLLTSITALATVVEIYKLLPNATIALNATSQPLYELPWIPGIHQEHNPQLKTPLVTFPMSWPATFACIAFFESGSFTVEPSSLTKVMAMSVGDSLYIAAPLLCDPCERPSAHEVKRIVGNIGRPGIAMFIPPQEPRIRELDLSTWHMINHIGFDGRLEDHFDATSLHLSFTEYKLPIDVKTYGSRDNEVYFLESLVSAHDQGNWIGDLDILGAMNSPLFCPVTSLQCQHGGKVDVSDDMKKLKTIDNWSEFLDRPDNVAIVRSHKNWLGRLAATTLSIQMSYPTIVLPNRFCLDCIKAAWAEIFEKLKPPEDYDGNADVLYNLFLPRMARENEDFEALKSSLKDIFAEMSNAMIVC